MFRSEIVANMITSILRTCKPGFGSDIKSTSGYGSDVFEVLQGSDALHGSLKDW